MSEISFAFTPTTAQIRWMFDVVYGRLWLWLKTAGLTATVAGAFIFGYVEQPLGVALVMVGLAMFVFPTVYTRLGIRQLTASRLMGRRDVRITEYSVEMVTAHASGRYDIVLITTIAEGKLGWLLVTEGNTATIVPRDALTTEQAEFMNGFADRHAASKGSRGS